MYYGRLQDGQEIAVKLLSATSNQGKDEFCNEVLFQSLSFLLELCHPIRAASIGLPLEQPMATHAALTVHLQYHS